MMVTDKDSMRLNRLIVLIVFTSHSSLNLMRSVPYLSF